MLQTTKKPIFSIFIAAITVFVSCYVAYQVSGTIWGKVRIIYLDGYGALTLGHLANLELWRFFTSQLIHVHQPHMLYNAACLLALGSLLERRIGFVYLFSIWFLAGASGTLFSTFFGTPPWNAGTGASQAVLGMAGFGAIFMMKGKDTSLSLKIALALAIAPAILLDMMSAGYPKPGHVFSFAVGALIAAIGFRAGTRSPGSQ